MKSTVRNLLKIFLFLLSLTILLGVGSHLISQYYVHLNGKFYRRDVESLSFQGQKLPDLDTLAELQNLRQLDLCNTDLTLGEHEWLQRQLPECRILWQVLLGDQSCSPDTEKLTVTSLSEADVITMDFLPELKEVDALGCRDYEAIALLAERRPDCRVLCRIPLGGKTWTQDARRLFIRDGKAGEILKKLGALSHAEELTFLGQLPSTRELNAIRERFPRVKLSWRVELAGKNLPHTQENLDLTCMEIGDVSALREKLLYFPYLKSLDFRGTPMEEKDRRLLKKYYPQVEMTWEADLDGVKAPADTEILDLSGHQQLTLQQVEAEAAYLPRLQKIILCDCGFQNEDLAALNQRLQPVRVIWNVQAGGRNTRTDETYFAPNKWGLKMDNENIYNLRYCTDMICVDIGHAKGVTNCQWAAFMPNLEFLILADSKVKDLTPLQNLKKLKFLELFLLPNQDLSPLLGCTALEDLNLCYIYADPKPIAEMTWLKRLWWSGCWPAKHLLEKKLPGTQKNFRTRSSTGEGWREGHLYYEMRDFIGMGYMTG